MSEQNIISIILAAGKGTRMNKPDLHKVCTVLDGKTVLERAVETYAACGVNRHLLVVGQMAEQVMQTASSLQSNILYCYQASQRGTGHATKIAANLLASLNYAGDVLVVAGDKIIEKIFLQEFIEQFYVRDCDLLLATGKSIHYPASGRIVRAPSGSPLGIVEVFDIAKVKILNILKARTRLDEIPAEEVKQIVLKELGTEKKAALALGDLWKIILDDKSINDYLLKKYFTARDFTYQINSIEIPLAQLENADSANLSVYLFKAGALFYAINQIGSDNAQNEEYLTDVVKTLARGEAKIETMEVNSPEQVMAFNTPEELKNIEHALKEKRKKGEEHHPGGRRPSEWLAALKSTDAKVQHSFASLYGQEPELIEEKKKHLIKMLDKYLADFDDEPVIISRAPGRLNIMGRHIDHQGGYGNMIALERDVYAVIGRRKDDRNVIMKNMQPDRFPDREFSIDSILNPLATKDWLQFVNSDFVMDTIRKMKGDWSNYAKAAIARFQALFPNRPFHGMNIVLSGDIPIAAGLSSSSALFVSIAEGVVELNQLNIASQQFVELCGEGEWYVGTRGGAGDHAAMKFAQKGQLVQLGFFPLLLAKKVDFPKDHLLVVCNSHHKAKKTDGAGDIFNQRVACYHIGRELLKQSFPDLSADIEHLRDLNPAHLGLQYPELFEMLKILPETMSSQEVIHRLGKEKANTLLQSFPTTLDQYPIRRVVIYGLAEYERSRHCASLLERGSIDDFGRWMNISHDGDRVISADDQPFDLDYSDKVMDKLIKHAQQNPHFDNMAKLPGGYGCSIPEIDKMVDIALSVEGVKGAQLSGAGLGGCMMALVHKNSYENLKAKMIRDYYEPSSLEPDMFICRPVAGSGLISF